MKFILNILFLIPTITAYKIQLQGNLRIVGGSEAGPGQFPYQVGLILTKTSGKLSFCGGSLISKRFILTAAHCLVDATKATIYLGAHNKSSRNEPNRKTLITTINDFIIHEDWNERSVDNDIALIRLKKGIRLSKYIKTIQLPSKSESFENELAIASGWGMPSDNVLTTADILNYVKVSVLPNSVCEKYFRVVDKNKICTDGFRGKGTCFGDSGGPLAYNNGNGNILIGITSFGSGKCEDGKPSVYTRVSAYLEWIKENSQR